MVAHFEALKAKGIVPSGYIAILPEAAAGLEAAGTDDAKSVLAQLRGFISDHYVAQLELGRSYAASQNHKQARTTLGGAVKLAQIIGDGALVAVALREYIQAEAREKAQSQSTEAPNAN